MVALQTESAVRNGRAELDRYAVELSSQVHEGMRQTFAASIAVMLTRAVWIVALGVLLIFMIPELPLRSHQPAATEA